MRKNKEEQGEYIPQMRSKNRTPILLLAAMLDTNVGTLGFFFDHLEGVGLGQFIEGRERGIEHMYPCN